MRVDTEVSLTESNENSKVQNSVSCELEELHTIKKDQPTKKLVGWKRKTTEEKGKENYPPPGRRIRDLLAAGDPVLHPRRGAPSR